jgi:hypothetical protein
MTIVERAIKTRISCTLGTASVASNICLASLVPAFLYWISKGETHRNGEYNCQRKSISIHGDSTLPPPCPHVKGQCEFFKFFALQRSMDVTEFR